MLRKIRVAFAAKLIHFWDCAVKVGANAMPADMREDVLFVIHQRASQAADGVKRIEQFLEGNQIY